jgi:hypothetical protein
VARRGGRDRTAIAASAASACSLPTCSGGSRSPLPMQALHPSISRHTRTTTPDWGLLPPRGCAQRALWSASDRGSNHRGQSSIPRTRGSIRAPDAGREASRGAEHRIGPPTTPESVPHAISAEWAKYPGLLAPEAGLEPTTNRLTEVGLPQEFAELRADSANVRPVFDSSTLEVARRVAAKDVSGTLSRSAARHLAGTIFDAAAGDCDSGEPRSTG